MPEPKLMIITMLTIPELVLGVESVETGESITMTYACAIGKYANEEYQITPMPVPMDLIAPSFGGECTLAIPTQNVSMVGSLPLKEDSPHQIVQLFLEYWGKDNVLPSQADHTLLDIIGDTTLVASN